MKEQSLGNLFIVAAPSGGGKTSLVKQLVNDLTQLVVSVSHTTRDQRPGEEEGVHYFFVNNETFETMLAENLFLEHAIVFDHYYGTSKLFIEQHLKAGTDVVLDIDWQGAAQIKKLYPNAVTIFILPPSLDVLKQRLINRQRDNEAVIEKRMQRAQGELSHYTEFEYLIINDDFGKASYELRSIVTAHRLLTKRQIKVEERLLSFLLTT